MKCKIASVFFSKVLFLGGFFTPAYGSFYGTYNFLYTFFFLNFKYHAFVNPSFKPICFKD